MLTQEQNWQNIHNFHLFITTNLNGKKWNFEDEFWNYPTTLFLILDAYSTAIPNIMKNIWSTIWNRDLTKHNKYLRCKITKKIYDFQWQNENFISKNDMNYIIIYVQQMVRSQLNYKICTKAMNAVLWY